MGRVRARVRARWKRSGSRVRLKRLWVTRAPKGARIVIRCTPAKCPIKRRSLRTAKGGTVELTRLVRPRRLRAGATLEVRVLAWQRIGKVARFKATGGKTPRRAELCLPPGTAKPRAC